MNTKTQKTSNKTIFKEVFERASERQIQLLVAGLLKIMKVEWIQAICADLDLETIYTVLRLLKEEVIKRTKATETLDFSSSLQQLIADEENLSG